MSRGPENTFIAAVHRHLPVALHHEKMHNVYRGGTADVWYSGVKDLWVEYKWLDLPKGDNVIVDLVTGKNSPLSALQQHWIRSRQAEGRNVWVIVGTPKGGIVLDGSDWSRPHRTGDLRGRLLSRADVAAMIARFTGVT